MRLTLYFTQAGHDALKFAMGPLSADESIADAVVLNMGIWCGKAVVLQQIIPYYIPDRMREPGLEDAKMQQRFAKLLQFGAERRKSLKRTTRLFWKTTTKSFLDAATPEERDWTLVRIRFSCITDCCCPAEEITCMQMNSFAVDAAAVTVPWELLDVRVITESALNAGLNFQTDMVRGAVGEMQEVTGASALLVSAVAFSPNNLRAGASLQRSAWLCYTALAMKLVSADE